jgi:hypothetical protein
MELMPKFNQESTCDVINIDKLQVDEKHQILRAERVPTRYAPSVVLTLRCPSESRLCKVFLPRRYCSLITDDDIIAINDKQIVLHLVDKGTCRTTNQYQLNMVQDNSA